ncbi:MULTISPECIES: hypothetical protein [Bacillus]|nr:MULTISPECIES: hypothetical protein [Bacillus]
MQHYLDDVIETIKSYLVRVGENIVFLGGSLIVLALIIFAGMR